MSYSVGGVTQTLNLFNETTGDMKNTYEVLSSIAQGWDEMTQAEKSSIALQLAGKTQIDVISSVLANFDTAIDATTTSIASSGSAMAENEKYMDSLKAKTTGLKKAFDDFITDTINSGFVKGFLDMNTSILTTIGNMDSLGVVIVGLLAVPIINKIGKIAGGLGKLKDSLKTTAVAFKAVASGALNALKAFKAIRAGTATTSQFMTATASQFKTVIGAAVGAVALIIGAIDTYKAKQKEALQTTIANADATLERVKSLEDLASQYEEIANSDLDEAQKTEQLNAIKKTLVGTYGLEESAINNTTAAREDSIAAIEAESRASIDAEVNSMEASGSLEKAQKKMAQTSKELGTVAILSPEIIESLKQYGIETLNAGTTAQSLIIKGENLEAMYNNLNTVLTMYSQKSKSAAGLTADETRVYQILQEALGGIEEEYTTYNPVIEKYNSLLAKQAILASGVSKSTVDSISSYQEYKSTAMAAAGGNEEVKKVISDLVDSYFPQYSNAIGNTSNDLDGLIAITDEAGNVTYALAGTLDTAMNALDDLNNSLNSIKGAFEDFNEDGDLSYSTISKIYDKFSDVEGIDSYIEALSNANLTSEDFNGIMGELTEKLIAQKIQSGELGSENENLIAKMLEEAGVADSLIAARELLAKYSGESAKANDDQAESSDNAKKSADDQASAEKNLTKSSDDAAGATKGLKDEIIVLSNTNYSSAQTVGQINAITSAAHAAESALKRLSGGGGGSSSNPNVTPATSSGSGGEYKISPLSSVQYELEPISYKKYGSDIIQFTPPGTTSSGGTSSSGTSGGGGGTSSSSGVSSSSSSDTEKTRLDIVKEEISLLQKLIDLFDKSSKNSSKQITLYKQMQQKVHATADYYRKLGYSETSEEIITLQNMWWDYADEIAKINKSIYENQKDKYETAAEYAQKITNEQIDDLEKQKSAIEEEYDTRIQALQKENDAIQDQIDLEQALKNLAEAKAKKVFVYADGQFKYAEDIEAVTQAQKELDNLQRQQALDKTVEELESQRDKETAAIDNQIDKLQEYSDSWDKVLNAYTDAQNRMIALEILGANFESKSLSERIMALDKFYNNYNNILHNISSIENIRDVMPGGLNLRNYSKASSYFNAPTSKDFGILKSSAPNITNVNQSFGNITLPNVTNASEFADELKNLNLYAYQT